MPSVQEIFLKHFDNLITEGNEIDLEHYSDDSDYLLRAKFNGWSLRCLTFFEKAFGKESDYYKNLKSWLGLDNPWLKKTMH